MNSDDEHSRIEAEALNARRARDFDDLQNEIAGHETGRAARFLSPEAAGGNAADKRRTERAEALTRLQMLLMANPEYAALYHATGNGLRETQNELDKMRERAQRLFEAENDAIDRIDARAARDTQGRPVFRDQSGTVRYADGAPVPTEEAESIVWRGDEPGFEERREHAERRERIGERIADIDAGQAEIGEMQERLDDEANPLSADELQTMQERAAELEASLEERFAGRLTIQPIFDIPADPPPQGPVRTAAVEVPKLP